MKKSVAIILPLFIINTATFAQDLSKPSLKSIVTSEEISAVDAEEPRSYRVSVNFEQNSLGLTPLSSAALDSVSALFALNKRNRYEVHGYSCPDAGGGQGKTMRLSAQRVERMVNHLTAIGVSGENIITVVNVPKTVGAAKGGCNDDRQVDIISIGTRWRDYEPTAAPEPPKVAAPETPSEPEPPAPAEPAPPEPQIAAPEPPALKPVPTEPGKQTIAVYMAGEEPQGARGVHNIMGGELARVMSESDKYTAVDRTEAILEQLDREHVYQRSGAVDDDQIKAIGHQLGVEYLCISNINAVGKRYYLDTRLVDVVTAEITRSVTATSALKDANEMTRVGRNIALELLEADRTREQRLRKKKIFRYTAVGLDALGAAAFAYGYIENNNVVKHAERYFDNGKEYVKNGPEADRAATRRNAAYIIGGALIASGVTIHILF